MQRIIDERRQSERHACRYEANWSYFNTAEGLEGRILNFNLTGSYLQVDRPILPGATVLIRVLARRDAAEYPFGLPMHAVAEVKWCREVENGEKEAYAAGVRYCYPV
jgi:hypothetical protein